MDLPGSYVEDLQDQYRHFQSQLQLTLAQPGKSNKTFADLVSFLAHLTPHYKNELKEFPEQAMNLLENNHAVLHAASRKALLKALILLRNKNVIAPDVGLPMMFKLFRCRDKELRQSVFAHIVADIKNLNKKARNQGLNRKLQNFMYAMLEDSEENAAKKSLEVMIELYNRGVWNDAKTVNVISTACFLGSSKLLIAALHFFLESSPDKEEEKEREREERVKTKDLLFKLNKGHSNKTKHKQRLVDKTMAKLHKQRKRKELMVWPVLQLINDPQNFAERLFALIKRCREKFEVRVMLMDLTSRLIGSHQLVLPNFYPYLQSYLQPSQKEVTHILAILIQACHSLVLPDCLQPVLSRICHNFITDRSSEEVMTIGINSVRSICARCPLAMDETLLHDLAQYRGHQNKGVAMASKSLIALFREINPGLLHKKFRGKDADMDQKTLGYGEFNPATGVD
eukprot:CAMPEP_0177631036 /NCGR_PEP_ID=MMETSP0447-20121125/1534_1 /TAXON_ID=0 /ORGANISM="Stygamoeba regulata, Strain BSH-02190019" /LENGTH=454 /DNA_ID=CAMNT_0019132491 /DNA_START=383 /DNA_END=1744 /DNA_ORIENTATION=+